MGRKLSRQTLGLKFSEAARRTWLLLGEKGWSQAALAKACGVDAGHFCTLLYGDTRAGAVVGDRIETTIGIDHRLWRKPPAEPFTLPAVAAEEQARAKLAEAERQVAGRAS